MAQFTTFSILFWVCVPYNLPQKTKVSPIFLGHQANSPMQKKALTSCHSYLTRLVALV